MWAAPKRPFLVSAPLANVSDAAYRRMICKYGAPAAVWTEFVSCGGLLRNETAILLPDLSFGDTERPIVAQLFGADPHEFEACAARIRELGFDGIDINMGCPDPNVTVGQGAGAALIQTPELAKAIVRAARRGAGHLPVSVKTRVGYDRPTLEPWLAHLMEEEPAAVTVHARTKKQLSRVPADWAFVGQAVRLRDRLGVRTLILGNGDVSSAAEGRAWALEQGADGAMVGRATFGAPWFFDGCPPVDLATRLGIMLEHSMLFHLLFAPHRKSYAWMTKHFKAYCSGFPGARQLRTALSPVRDGLSLVATLCEHVAGDDQLDRRDALGALEYALRAVQELREEAAARPGSVVGTPPLRRAEELAGDADEVIGALGRGIARIGAT